MAGEPPLQTAATRRAVFPGVGTAAMLPASMRQLRLRVAQIAMRGLSFVQGPRSRDLVWGLTTVGSPPRRPPRTWLLLPDVITYRCDRAVGLTVDNQNRRHPHNDSVCCRRDFSRTRPRCMLPHATVTDPLVPVLPAVERQRMASRVMVQGAMCCDKSTRPRCSGPYTGRRGLGFLASLLARDRQERSRTRARAREFRSEIWTRLVQNDCMSPSVSVVDRAKTP